MADRNPPKAILLGTDGKPIHCWEPRPGYYLRVSAYSAEEAIQKYPPDYSDIRPWTKDDVESHRLTGYRVGDPRIRVIE